MGKSNNIAKCQRETCIMRLSRARVNLTTPKTDAISRLTEHADVSEKAIEKYIVKRAGECGLPCLKYSNPNMVGYPDRILVLPGGSVIWVELKSKDRKPSKIQKARIAELISMGHAVMVIDNKAEIDELIKRIEK